LEKEETEREPYYAKGLIAFEYTKLTGEKDGISAARHQREPFWQAFEAARKRFKEYSYRTLPSPGAYEGDILLFLEDLGYQRGNFVFFPTAEKQNPRRLC
jgi:hypothetical protein